MKITKFRQRIAAALLASGISVPFSVFAAPLDTNLLINPSFENVDPNTTVGSYGALLILDWAGGGGAYAYSQNYHNGTPIPGSGDRYFTPNAVAKPGCDLGGTVLCGAISQEHDLSTGDSGIVINGRRARYELSAYFSSYLADGDLGAALVEFLDASGTTVLATGSVQDTDPSSWEPRNSVSGVIPVGTVTARITLHGIPVMFGPDGYIDLVDFRVLDGPVRIDGDFDNNGVYNCADINQLTTAVATGGSVATYDLNGDGSLTIMDVHVWRSEAGNVNIGPGRPYKPADVNLSGAVDNADFNLWFQSRFSNNTNWCSGNLNADLVVDAQDFHIWNEFKGTSSEGGVVPEPGSWVMSIVALAGLGLLRYRP